MSWARVATAALMFEALLITGCSWNTHSTTLLGDGPSAGQVIYRVSEETAFTTALDAYAVLYPKQTVDDFVDGDRRGYNADERYGLWGAWHHRILVVPAIGADASGNEVHGYWYAYSGGGTLRPNAERITGLLQFIRAQLDATGTAVVVTNLRDGKYETDGRAYLGLKRDARDIRPGARPHGEK
jgi:hypothetical protein